MIEFLLVALVFYFLGRLSVTNKDAEWVAQKIKRPHIKRDVGAIDYISPKQREEMEQETGETREMRTLLKDVLKIKPKTDNIE